jgi:acetyltransferase-like isoleucine patch superfamily enzyme
MSGETGYKIKADQGGAFAKYRTLIYGDQSLGKVVLGETLFFLFGSMPGAPGLFLRMKLYPMLFASCGRKVVFGKNLTLRHAHKITLGDQVVIDDNVVLDAKGQDNKGIVIGDGVYIGRNSIVYCKGGDLELGDRVNLSSNCQVFSSNKLRIGEGTMIGAFSYLLSGGEYDRESEVPYADQSGMETKGPLLIGANCWLGARVTVLDAACVGDDSVLAAGAVVTRSFPENSLLGGVPARSLKSEE